MYITPRTMYLSDGSSYTIRSTTVSDAKYVIPYQKTVAKETPYMIRYIDEIGENKRDSWITIKKFLDSPCRLSLLAFREETVLGMAAFCEVSPYRKAKHRASLSISVKECFWGRGLGHTLLNELEVQAKSCGYSQLELEVACNNAKAISLYLQLGFVIYGRRENAYYIEGEGFLAEYLMYKEL